MDSSTVLASAPRRRPRGILSLASHRIALMLIVVAALAPLVPILIWSFAFQWLWPNLLPSTWGLRGWQALSDPTAQVGTALVNSLEVAIAVTVLSLVVSIPAGRALGMHSFRGKSAVQFFLLLPIIVPGIAAVMGIDVAFIHYGLADTLQGVILVHLVPTVPYTVLVLASVFANYDVALEQTARTLGASLPKVWWYVTLRTIAPGLVVAGLFAFLISWSQYLLTLLIGGGNVMTLPVLLFSTAAGGDYPLTAALSVIFFAPTLILLLASSRFLSGESAAVGGFGNL